MIHRMCRDIMRAFFLQWECMAQRIETGCAGTIGSLYEIGCGSGVNLYLFSR